MTHISRLLLQIQGNEGNYDRLRTKLFSISRQMLHQVTLSISCIAPMSVYISDMKAYKFDQLNTGAKKSRFFEYLAIRGFPCEDQNLS
jgi:hypothetical protein